MVNRTPPPVDSDPLTAIHIREHTERPAGIKGGFRLSLTSGQWWWSPGVFELHGFGPRRPGAARPSTRLLLTRRHPADRRAFTEAWRHLLIDGGVVAMRYRIIGVDRRVRPVFVMAYLDEITGRGARFVTGVMQSEDDDVAPDDPRSIPQQNVEPPA
jgi:hypothetical protein